MTVICKRIVAKVYGFSYAKPLFEFEAKLGEKEQNVYKISNKIKNCMETFETYMCTNSTWLAK